MIVNGYWEPKFIKAVMLELRKIREKVLKPTIRNHYEITRMLDETECSHERNSTEDLTVQMVNLEST